MDRFISLSVFVAAVEDGSIAAAGRRFGLSPVMAGRYLAALEDQVAYGWYSAPRASST